MYAHSRASHTPLHNQTHSYVSKFITELSAQYLIQNQKQEKKRTYVVKNVEKKTNKKKWMMKRRHTSFSQEERTAARKTGWAAIKNRMFHLWKILLEIRLVERSRKLMLKQNDVDVHISCVDVWRQIICNQN